MVSGKKRSHASPRDVVFATSLENRKVVAFEPSQNIVFIVKIKMETKTTAKNILNYTAKKWKLNVF